jgi:hypothetical protein
VGEAMRCFPVFGPATDLEKKEKNLRRHTSVKLWARQLDSEFSDLDSKYYSHRSTVI